MKCLKIKATDSNNQAVFQCSAWGDWMMFWARASVCIAQLSAGTGWCEHASQAVIQPWASHVLQSWVWAERHRRWAHDSLDAPAATAGMWGRRRRRRRRRKRSRREHNCFVFSLWLYLLCEPLCTHRWGGGWLSAVECCYETVCSPSQLNSLLQRRQQVCHQLQIAFSSRC